MKLEDSREGCSQVFTIPLAHLEAFWMPHMLLSPHGNAHGQGVLGRSPLCPKLMLAITEMKAEDIACGGRFE